jgi:hypothetical protein
VQEPGGDARLFYLQAGTGGGGAGWLQMTDPTPTTPAPPQVQPEAPEPASPQPEINPGGAPIEQPSFDPPTDPGEWRPHD